MPSGTVITAKTGSPTSISFEPTARPVWICFTVTLADAVLLYDLKPAVTLSVSAFSSAPTVRIPSELIFVSLLVFPDTRQSTVGSFAPLTAAVNCFELPGYITSVFGVSEIEAASPLSSA